MSNSGNLIKVQNAFRAKTAKSLGDPAYKVALSDKSKLLNKDIANSKVEAPKAGESSPSDIKVPSLSVPEVPSVPEAPDVGTPVLEPSPCCQVLFFPKYVVM